MPVAKLIDYSSVLRPCTIRKVAHIESSDNLMHYGIKGMKWGVRRTKEQLAHDRSSIQARMNSQLRTPVKADNLGRPSQQFIGKSATVAVNPENGTITTTWCTGSRTKRKYLKKG